MWGVLLSTREHPIESIRLAADSKNELCKSLVERPSLESQGIVPQSEIIGSKFHVLNVTQIELDCKGFLKKFFKRRNHKPAGFQWVRCKSLIAKDGHTGFSLFFSLEEYKKERRGFVGI